MERSLGRSRPDYGVEPSDLAPFPGSLVALGPSGWSVRPIQPSAGRERWVGGTAGVQRGRPGLGWRTARVQGLPQVPRGEGQVEATPRPGRARRASPFSARLVRRRTVDSRLARRARPGALRMCGFHCTSFQLPPAGPAGPPPRRTDEEADASHSRTDGVYLERLPDLPPTHGNPPLSTEGTVGVRTGPGTRGGTVSHCPDLLSALRDPKTSPFLESLGGRSRSEK